MKPVAIEKPAAEEYNPYYGGYISQVTEPDLLGMLASQPAEVATTFGKLDDSQGTFAYAEGKWTLKELVSHVIDGERHFGYRIHRISRGDQTPIEGFEQDDYIATSHANQRSFADMVSEFTELRQANLRPIHTLSESDWKRTGIASGSPISVRALGYIMAGHVRHHLSIVRERYLVK
ncbi:MAG: DinB family protein [Pyrinomonadaceae bacterium]